MKDVTRRTKRERKLSALDETPLKICWEKGNWRDKERAAKKKQKRKMKRGKNGIGTGRRTASVRVTGVVPVERANGVRNIAFIAEEL